MGVFLNPKIYFGSALLLILLLLNSAYLHSNPQSPQQRDYPPLYAPVSNSFFMRQQEIWDFFYNNTQRLAQLNNKIAELPVSFGYPFQKGNKIFPPFIYPPCQEVEGPIPTDAWIKIDYQTNILSMSCPQGTKPQYVLGPPKSVGRFLHLENTWDNWPVKKYKEPVKVDKNYDLAIGICKGSKIHSFFHQPRYNQKIHRKAIETTNKVSKVNREKPMIILGIGIDSFSRNMFYRKLNQTLDYMNGLNKEGEWTIYDFLIHNIQGRGTAQNVSEMFGTDNSIYWRLVQDPLGHIGIWNLLREKGFISMIGFETCSQLLNRALGFDPPVDHIVNPFYCALARIVHFNWQKQSTQQRCVGDKMSSWYLMNYTKAFTKLYPGANQWIYNHYDNCHQKTGQHGQTLDFDLKDFVRTYIEEYSKDFEVIIYLVADHGMRFGKFRRNEQAIQQYRLPAFFLITRTSFLDQIPYSYSTLAHNTKRMTTKGDLRSSMIWLAHWQNGFNSKQYKNYVNLFTERAPNERRCQDIDVDLWYCAGLQLQPYTVPLNRDFKGLSDKDTFIQSLIFQIADYIIDYVNLRGYMSRVGQNGIFCQFLQLGDIFDIKIAKRSQRAWELFLNINIKDRSHVIFQGVAIVGEELENHQIGYLLDPVMFKDQRLLLQIQDIGRIDPYAGPCETISNKEKRNARFCICTEYAYEKHPEVY